MTSEPQPIEPNEARRRWWRPRLSVPVDRTQVRAGAVVVLVIAALVVAVLVSLLGSGDAVRTIGAADLSGDGASTSAIDASTSSASPGAGDEVFVHVLGAVALPGLYRLPDGSRAFDAIAAAGGLLPEADQAGVNLARFVSDGEQLRVPMTGETPVGAVPGQAPSGAVGASPVNLNTASAAELVGLPRIGEALAARIVAWREANGPFATVDDLGAVEGIGAKTLDGLRDLATV
ncbi:ComEA family DNA-binding protein [Plantibacter flavus]|uniref:helix-hairpin-helix domain-containing protein n=1 Tax=Plantibacter flavus TaxID=150123 RepID=UPI003F18B93D